MRESQDTPEPCRVATCTVCGRKFTTAFVNASTCSDDCWIVAEQQYEAMSDSWAEPDDRYLEE